MPKRFGHSSFVLLTVASAFCFTGCRTATDGLARIPGLGWMNRSDEQWAKYEPAPGLPRPSEFAEPTDPSDPTSGPGVSGIASSDQLRGSASRSFDKVASKLDDVDADRFDASRYVPKSDSGSELGSKYAAAYGKFGPPKSQNASAKQPKFGATQSGPYDVESPKAAPKFAASGDEKFAKNGYDLGYEPRKSSAPNKPYVSPSSSSGDSGSKSPYGYASGNRFEAPKALGDAATKVATAAKNSLPKFEPGKYSSPNFSSNSFAPAANDKLATASSNVAAAAGGLVNGVSSAATQAKNKTVTATNQFNSNANQFAGSLNGASTSVANNAAKFGNQLSNTAKQQTNQFANNAANAMQNTQQSYNRFGAGAKAQANSAISSARNSVGQFANNNGNTSMNLTPPAATQTAQNFGNYAANTANQLANSAKSAVNSVTNNGTFATGNATAPRAGFGQGMQGLAQTASQTAAQSIADAKKAIAGNANAAARNFSAQAGQAANAAANTFNQFGQNASTAVQNQAGNQLNSLSNSAGNIQQQSVGQFQTYAQQAQQNVEQSVTNTYGQAKQAVEQSVASQYQQAKNAVGQYANTAVNSAQTQASNFAGSMANLVTNNRTFQNAAAALGNVQQKLTGANSAANRAMQNVSAPMQSSYPSTTTPNPYVVPGSQIKGAANRFSPPQMNQPSATSNPGSAPSNYNIPPATDGPAFRTATPFLPGSTQSFQGAQTTTRKPNLQTPSVKLASATADVSNRDEQLVLAVGDQYQFPRTLR